MSVRLSHSRSLCKFRSFTLVLYEYCGAFFYLDIYTSHFYKGDFVIYHNWYLYSLIIQNSTIMCIQWILYWLNGKCIGFCVYFSQIKAYLCQNLRMRTPYFPTWIHDSMNLACIHSRRYHTRIIIQNHNSLHNISCLCKTLKPQ